MLLTQLKCINFNVISVSSFFFSFFSQNEASIDLGIDRLSIIDMQLQTDNRQYKPKSINVLEFFSQRKRNTQSFHGHQVFVYFAVPFSSHRCLFSFHRSAPFASYIISFRLTIFQIQMKCDMKQLHYMLGITHMRLYKLRNIEWWNRLAKVWTKLWDKRQK